MRPLPRVTLSRGDMVLTEAGTSVVREVDAHGVKLVAPDGAVLTMSYLNLCPVRGFEAGKVQAIAETLEPAWSSLRPEARQIALTRLEVVLEVLTGYRRGRPELALPGEPHGIFDRARHESLRQRCARMAEMLTVEGELSRETQRRLSAAEITSVSVSASTVNNWVTAYQRERILGLIDGRQARGRHTWALDPVLMQALDAEITRLDGSESTVNNQEIIRSARAGLQHQGHVDAAPNEAQTLEYVSHRRRGRGRTTRSQRSHALSAIAASTSFPAVRPGQVVAIDATRFDNLVRDPVTERVYSVEILTAIDVATRVVLGLRVTPRSANSGDLAMLMYDVMRPMSMLVDATTVHDWRWVGVPEAIGWPASAWLSQLVNDDPSLQGEHIKPALVPEAIRCDHGSIFLAERFGMLLDRFQIDLLLNRGSTPTDNATVERIHETYQKAVQQWPGYKGRSVAERGTRVGKSDADKLLHPAELERFLRRWIALEYHRRPHDGLVLPGAEDQSISPLAMFDALSKISGRLHVLQHPDLIFDFLPIAFLTPGRSGVERRNLTYDCPALGDFRNVRVGEFVPDSRQMPFFYDPHDLSRLWFRHPETRRMVEVPWKGAYKLLAPLTETTLSAVRTTINRRAGHRGAAAHAPAQQILDVLTDLMTPSAGGAAHWGEATSEQLRFQRANHDHAEAAALRHSTTPPGQSPVQKPTVLTDARAQVAEDNDAWPDFDAAGY